MSHLNLEKTILEEKDTSIFVM